MKTRVLLTVLLCCATRILFAQASLNETARFLAGMSVPGDSPLAPLTRDPAWQQHAQFFDTAWAKLDRRQLSPVRAWSSKYLRSRAENVFYMFSGPDFLYADAFFPHASTYVLCGIEPVGSIPDATRVNLGPALQNLQGSLNSVLNYSFFQTKQMREDLGRGQLGGTLPVLMVFAARSGHSIRGIEFVQPHGVRIDLNDGALFYFSVDLSNGSVEKSGLLNFCRKLGRGDSLLKSASYLPHQNGFSTIRNFLLDHSNTIVQDDSGVPVRYFNPDQWQLRLFGNYSAPIDIFRQYYQPALDDMFAHSSPAALPFGIGYRGWDPRKSALIVAARR